MMCRIILVESGGVRFDLRKVQEFLLRKILVCKNLGLRI
jgi:hypothetical protein